jgi:hypothetical protein
LFAQASCVTATGSDETLENIRKRVPARAPFFGYGHKLSFGCIARESLGKIGLHKVLAAAAGDISTWDQLGCLSPHVLYVETGGATPVPGFAELLAKELERLHVERPRGRVSHETAAAISTRKMFYEVRAANSDGTKVWASPNSTAWTVVYEEDPQFQVSCLHRFIFVKPVADLKDVFHSAAAVHGRVSTVGVSAPAHRAQEMAVEFARWGVTRVCPLGKMQNPPLTWRHDGRPALGDLVVWTDLELS